MFTTQFKDQGFVCIPRVLTDDECKTLTWSTDQLNARSVGTRCLLSLVWARHCVARLRQDPRISQVVPADYVAVQCTYFEKSASRNWLVPVHQDLSIPVAARVEAAALGGWSEKEGALFVQPPTSVLERLIAVRLHLDACGEPDGPLMVVPGTHTVGRIESEDAADIRRRAPMTPCLAAAGDALVMRPLLLHASSKASGTSLRRVLHFLFGPPVLPFGLRWHHTA
ncbi:phytanoyl-CoA dioxygenase family protein [Caldimonas brevitalea]|uniref:Phytanoyl-CoA dioxygenase n=1 Tax=Caldimonas brevitalea TaxID=413882 RepID=A0A0G3BN43_9BURK|nr:phytanoyl-CoA dioxygenase family protein [Caldimonas brevitalea]AKJ30822.1 phytanoyl-CoA dioxygenase [Caldimonas brevitalea]